MVTSSYHSSETFPEGTTFIFTGATVGAGIYNTIGGVGIVGGFGGIGLGMTPLIGVGAVAGAATYGIFRAISDQDPVIWGAIGLGTIGGMAVSAGVGGIGVGFAGTAVGVGMGTLAFFCHSRQSKIKKEARKAGGNDDTAKKSQTQHQICGRILFNLQKHISRSQEL